MLLLYSPLALCLINVASAQFDCLEGCTAHCQDEHDEKCVLCTEKCKPMSCNDCAGKPDCRDADGVLCESSGGDRPVSMTQSKSTHDHHRRRRRSSRRRPKESRRRRRSSTRRRTKDESRRRTKDASRRRTRDESRRRTKEESRRRTKEESRRRTKEESRRRGPTEGARRRRSEPETRRRNSGGGGGGDGGDGGGGGGGGGMPAEPAYKCTPYSGSQFTGDVKKYVGNTNWCGCGYQENCAFICAGPGGGNCQGKTSCDDKTQTHDDKGTLGTWILNIKKDGGPFRAFGYMNKIKRSSFSPATSLSWTFKAVNHNVAYSKIFFWGDGANILGLKPPSSAGGASQFCLFPSADAPLNQIQCKATAECKPNTWYRIQLDLSGSSSITFNLNGKQIGSGSMNGNFARERPMIGVYHWTGNGGPSLEIPYQFHFRDMCLGKAELANR